MERHNEPAPESDAYALRDTRAGAPDPQVMVACGTASAQDIYALESADRVGVPVQRRWACVCTLVARHCETLVARAYRLAYATERYDLATIDRMPIDERVAIGDREALYDAVRELQSTLDQLADRVDNLLTDGRHLAAMAEMRRRRTEARGTDAATEAATTEG